jgi:hypothetical protein
MLRPGAALRNGEELYATAGREAGRGVGLG